jgi:hypothetical protein
MDCVQIFLPSECETAGIAMVYIQPVGNYTLQVSCTSIYKPLIVLCSTLLLDTCTRVELKHIITTGLDDDDLLLLTYLYHFMLLFGLP